MVSCNINISGSCDRWDLNIHWQRVDSFHLQLSELRMWWSTCFTTGYLPQGSQQMQNKSCNKNMRAHWPMLWRVRKNDNAYTIPYHTHVVNGKVYELIFWVVSCHQFISWPVWHKAHAKMYTSFMREMANFLLVLTNLKNKQTCHCKFILTTFI